MTISSPPDVVMYCGSTIRVDVPGAAVVLRGLTIDGMGALENGITVVAIGSLAVENCIIENFASEDVALGNGIFFGCAGTLFVSDTLVRNNGHVGVLVE